MSVKRNYLWNLLIAGGIIAFSAACEKDDNNTDDNNQPLEATLAVSSQVISQNQVRVSMADVPSDGWIVIHKDNGQNAPVVPDIVSEPKRISKGSNQEVLVSFNSSVSLSDGEKFWIMLHEDTGVKGEYEFDGQNNLDGPFKANGQIVMQSININSAMIDVSNATYNASDNTVTIPSVTAAVDGWLVIHNDNGAGAPVIPGIIGKVQVPAGTSANVQIELDNSVTITPGQLLFPMLHIDTDIIGEYEFDTNSGKDGPEIFGNEPGTARIIVTAFTVL